MGSDALDLRDRQAASRSGLTVEGGGAPAGASGGGNGSEERSGPDWWARAETIAKIVGAIFIPMAVLVGGTWLSEDHKRTEAAERARKQMLDIGNWLFDPDVNKRRFGFVLLETMKSELEATGRGHEFPLSLYRVVETIEANAAALATAAAGQPADRQSPAPPAAGVPGAAAPTAPPVLSEQGVAAEALQRDAAQFLKSLPPRLYVQIASEDQRPAARAFELRIEAEEVNKGRIVVPGIERRGRPPSATELRYAHDSDAGEAKQIADKIGAILGSPVRVVKISPDGSRLRHYELWFAPGGIKLPSS